MAYFALKMLNLNQINHEQTMPSACLKVLNPQKLFLPIQAWYEFESFKIILVRIWKFLKIMQISVDVIQDIAWFDQLSKLSTWP